LHAWLICINISLNLQFFYSYIMPFFRKNINNTRVLNIAVARVYVKFALDQSQKWKLWSYTVCSLWWNAYIDAVTYCSVLGRWILCISRLRCFGDTTFFSILPRPGRFNAEHLLLKRVKGFAFFIKIYHYAVE